MRNTRNNNIRDIFEFEGELTLDHLLSDEFDREGHSLGVIACLLVVGNRIELAESLLATGVLPEKITPEAARQLGAGFLGKSDTIPLAHFFLRKHYNTLLDRRQWTRVEGQEVDPMETLFYLLKNPDFWHMGLNESAGDHTLMSVIPSAQGKEKWNNLVELIDHLIEAGADINRHTDTTNAATNIIYSGPTEFGETKTKDATVASLQMLIDRGFDITLSPHITLSAAMEADFWQSQGKKELTERSNVMIEMGFPVVSPVDCPQEVNPFCVAVNTANGPMIDILLRAGCDPCWIDPKTGDTLFSLAAGKPKKIVDTLLKIPNEKLARVVNHPNSNGDTPLHLAVGGLSTPLVEKLIACGAKVDPVNKKGKLPLQMVKRTSPSTKKKLDQIIGILEANGSEVSTQALPGLLHQACKSLSGDIVKKLIESGADVNELDSQGRTPLIVLAQSKKTSYYEGEVQEEAKRDFERITDALLDAGANIHASDKGGNTALHYAVLTISPMTGVLLNRGSDPDTFNKNGLAPGHMWADQWISKQKGTEAIIQQFFDTGFNPDLPGKDGILPFHYCRDGDTFRVGRVEMESRELKAHTSQAYASPRKRSRL